MPGHVDFGAEALDVDGGLPDGVHRLEGSLWQFVVKEGRIVRGVREDLQAWWLSDHVIHAAEGDEEGQAADNGEI
jgi:hypothetical protein